MIFPCPARLVSHPGGPGGRADRVEVGPGSRADRLEVGPGN